MSDLPLLERVPPQSLEAEQSTLGAMITEREAIAPAMQLLQPDDFYNPQHQIIFRAIVDLFSEGKPADMTMLPVLLQDRAQLEQAGGTRYLCALMDSLPSAKSVKHYAAIVRQKATLRCLIQHAGEVRNLAQNPGELDTNEILAQCEQEFATLKQRMASGVATRSAGFATSPSGANSASSPWPWSGSTRHPTSVEPFARRPEVGKRQLTKGMYRLILTPCT